MNDEKNFGAPVLDDIDYTAPTEKKSGPTGVSAPVLDDMDTYIPKDTKKKGAPTNVTAPVLDDNDYTYQSASKPAIITDDEIIAGLNAEQRAMFDNLPAEKQRQIIDMRRTQLEAQNAPVTAPVLDDEDSYVPPPKKETVQPAAPVTAPVLDDEDSYVPPPKKETAQPAAPVTAPVLDDEPAPAKYVPKFVDEDLERTKAEAKKKAVSSQLVSNQKDEKESLRMMLELKAEREEEAAKKGFITVIVVAVIGIAAAIMFYLLYSGGFAGIEYKDEGNKFCQFLENNSFIVAVIGGLLSLSLITGIGGLKSLCSVFFLIFSGIQVIGVFAILPQISGGAVKWILCICALIGSISVLVVPSASENVGMFYKKPKKEFDH
ncbi:MAG: ABC transporter permease [Oscillospiraceae bacterium]|nr:ABC transporter permease [Oscillospiraceae bacterium]